VRRLRAWLWRVTHRREARRFDEYMRQIYQWSDEYDARRDEWTPMPPIDVYDCEVLVTSVEKAEDPTYPPDGADSERVAERLTRYVGER